PRRRGGAEGHFEPAPRGGLDQGRARRAHQHHGRPRFEPARGERGGDAHPGGGGRGGQHHLRRRHRRVDGRRGAHNGDRDGLRRARGGRREAPARPARGWGGGGG